MAIRIEFFGIPRARAGVAELLLDCAADCTLAEALRKLAQVKPGWAGDESGGESLPAEYIASINGRRFVRDPQTLLASGDTVILLSADAGG